MRMTKAAKAIEDQVHAAYAKHGHCVQVPMMDLGKIHNAGRAAGQAGEDIGEAVKAAVAQYRVSQ